MSEFFSHINYKFNINELKQAYEIRSLDPANVRKHPYREHEDMAGREICGWGHNLIRQMYNGTKEWPSEYFKKLSFDFPFKSAAYWFLKNDPYYHWPVHYDGYKETWTEEKIKFTSKSKNLTGYPLERHIRFMSDGPKCAILVKLEEDNVPLYFTRENQRHWNPDDFLERPARDYKYNYKACLVDAQWTHYVRSDEKRRLIFRISIYEESFNEVRDMLISKGLIDV